MKALAEIQCNSWDGPCSQDLKTDVIEALEAGRVVYFPQLPFKLEPEEERFLSPEILSGKRKNISFDGSTGAISGSNLASKQQKDLQRIMQRFMDQTYNLLKSFLPTYSDHLRIGRTSFRPAEVAGRASSYKKDDTRLHIDAFPSSPVRDLRIIRVFSNINPDHKPRVWRVGESFGGVAKKFLPSIAKPVPGSACLLKSFGMTKGLRTPYDHYMLQLHDSMKADTGYQQAVEQEVVSFPAGCSWMVFTDQVSHAAVSGQYTLEQTFYLPVSAMVHDEHSPLRVLERMMQKELV